jgi:AcrR family transcriptional regulator
MNQLKHSTARQKWLECGYELFAQDRADGLQVERLARILKLNKSGFYHYFSEPEIFLVTLFNYHRDQARQMALHIQECKLLDPDYFKVIVKFKLFVLVQGKLISRNNNLSYCEVFKEAREITEKDFLPSR